MSAGCITSWVASMQKSKISEWFIRNNSKMCTVADRTNFRAKGTPRTKHFYNLDNYLYD